MNIKNPTSKLGKNTKRIREQKEVSQGDICRVVGSDCAQVNNIKAEKDNPTLATIFKGRKLVIATMHAKEQVIAPLLKKHLAVEIVVPKQFNSDQFGTFTRDIKRAGNQLEAARAKLLAAMEIEGVDLGVSSEGSFGEHPSISFAQSNLELLLFIDKKNGYEIRGHYRTSETNIDGEYVATVKEALNFAKKVGFPKHGIIVRKSKDGKSEIYKNIQTKEDLIKTASKMLCSIHTKRIFIESDMRAHKNPTRMKAIAKATEDLIRNIKSLCPKCHSPGFVVVDFEKGLKCSLCGLPTDLPLNDIYQCAICGYNEKRLVTKYGKAANPAQCGYCNP